MIFCKPLIGWGNRSKGDTDSTARLLDSSPLVSFVEAPVLEGTEWGKNFWWRENLSEVGLRIGDQAISWDPKQAHAYHVDISYPTRGDGYCALAVLPRPLKKFEYPTAFHCLWMPYTSASLEILLSLTSTFSQIDLGRVECSQWTDY